MREQRTPTSLRGVESVPERGAGRSFVCNVGGKASCSRKLRKKIDISHAATLSRFIARGGASDGSRPCRGGRGTTPPLWYTGRELRLRSVRLLLLLTQTPAPAKTRLHTKA